MGNRNARKSGKNRREQTPKGRNKGWAEARIQHANMNLTVPSGKRYKRPAPGEKFND